MFVFGVAFSPLVLSFDEPDAFQERHPDVSLDMLQMVAL